MATEWIEQLAEDMKQKNRAAAQEYGRAQHYAGVVEVAGKEFFVALGLCLQENVDALRGRLQGDAVASEMRFESVSASERKITRERFPWVDARLLHRGEAIQLEYAKGPGAKPAEVAGAAAGERISRVFALKADASDRLYVEDAFAEPSVRYESAKELARRITEILFGA